MRLVTRYIRLAYFRAQGSGLRAQGSGLSDPGPRAPDPDLLLLERQFVRGIHECAGVRFARRPRDREGESEYYLLVTDVPSAANTGGQRERPLPAGALDLNRLIEGRNRLEHHVKHRPKPIDCAAGEKRRCQLFAANDREITFLKRRSRSLQPRESDIPVPV